MYFPICGNSLPYLVIFTMSTFIQSDIILGDFPNHINPLSYLVIFNVYLRQSCDKGQGTVFLNIKLDKVQFSNIDMDTRTLH